MEIGKREIQIQMRLIGCIPTVAVMQSRCDSVISSFRVKANHFTAKLFSNIIERGGGDSESHGKSNPIRV